jgi:predicted nucleic acid-binding protein
MSKKSGEPKILLDADVVIHFIKAGQQLLLPKVFPNRFVMLDKVHKELTIRDSKALPINNFLTWCKIPIIPIPVNAEIVREYARLKRELGEGEAACLAVARYTKDYVASSNLKDIYDYCNEHGIIYYTTMDLLLELYNQGIMNEAACDQFIVDVKSKGSRLINEVDKIEQYKKIKKDKK